tara:strand:+ start:376 stop:1029 length:654 start_codon:yes stop_codon:yes gene_type:complete
MIKFFNYFLVTFLFFFTPAYSTNIKVFEFTKDELTNLKVRKVRGADEKTKYSVGDNENGNFLRAEANNSASGLGKEITINLLETPFLNITWKVEKDLPGINESSKKGHDYAARVFVVKKTGATPLSNRAMNYVFSSNKNVNTYHPSPFTKKSIDYVLSTTKDNFNEWVTVKVNVREHFKKFHNLNLEEINGIAIMSDTDNSKLNSIAYYQNIYFSSN